MEVTLTYQSTLKTAFDNYNIENNTEILGLYNQWWTDEKLKGASLKQDETIDKFIEFMYIGLQAIEASFNTTWKI